MNDRVGERPIRVLVVCTGNSARSLMGEALLRHHGGSAFEVHSAGTEPKGIHPLTERVLDEAGIDHTWARSKSVNEFLGQSFDYVITVCAQARQTGPVFLVVHATLTGATSTLRPSRSLTRNVRR